MHLTTNLCADLVSSCIGLISESVPRSVLGFICIGSWNSFNLIRKAVVKFYTTSRPSVSKLSVSIIVSFILTLFLSWFNAFIWVCFSSTSLQGWPQGLGHSVAFLKAFQIIALDILSKAGLLVDLHEEWARLQSILGVSMEPIF